MSGEAARVPLSPSDAGHHASDAEQPPGVTLRRFIQGRSMTGTEIDALATRVAAAFTPPPSRGLAAPGQPG
jgi:hypothetical protein